MMDFAPKSQTLAELRGSGHCATVSHTVVAGSSLLGLNRRICAHGLTVGMGKIRGTLCMRRHICVLLPTTKSVDKFFVFKNDVAKKELPRDNPSGLGAGGSEFKSRRPYLIFCFASVSNAHEPSLSAPQALLFQLSHSRLLRHLRCPGQLPVARNSWPD